MKKINKNTLIIAATVLVLVIIGIIGYVFSINKKVTAWENKIYPQINVYGVNIGGLNKDEATALLEEKLPSVIMDKKLKVIVGEKSIELTYDTLNPTYDVQGIVDEALEYGKDKGLFARNSLIKGDKTIELGAEIKYDEEALIAFEDKVLEEINVEPKNASININSGNITITPEESGKTIDKNELHNKLIENINGDPSKEVELTFELKEQEANIKSADLEKITGRISSYSSNYTNTGDGRVRNMEIAAETINGTIVMPGEEFSYNALIGDTTPDKGYEKANTYIGNKIVPDYGGGICQVSTTLYRAVMRANIRSTERMNHSLTVSYSEPGLDATVANGVIDYKFVNTYDFPIYIQGYVSGGVVNFSIYGNVEAMGNKTYDLVNEIHETYNAPKKYEDDATMEVGTEKVVSYGMTGYKASSYQVTYENGVEVDREFIATDVYLTTDTIVKKGTKKKEEPKKEENKPQENTQNQENANEETTDEAEQTPNQ
ncbi:VanW family protein [Clostridium sp. AL.422]|uniref:VanW family protein n=1 Tax=Clostridium TaxID=1485 RepID=UPI00293DFA95|nr:MULTISPECIES: VanW family protein [unclassified Clostridium]MDV4151872.1 VanW family protein [Clostridium sp. AL.422]